MADRRGASARGLLVLAAALVMVLALLDLAREGSLIRQAWRSWSEEGTPLEGFVRDVTGRSR